MPLKGYLKTSDPSRISSITVDGKKDRKKQLHETRYDSKSSRGLMYVRDCIAHDDNTSIGGLVPVELIKRTGTGWTPVGTVKCCVICWKIIEGYEELGLPEPSIQSDEMPDPKIKSRRALANGRKKAQQTRRPVGIDAEGSLTKRLMENNFWADEEWDVYELMDAYKVSRQVILGALNKLIEAGKIFASSTGPGRNHKTTYSQKKEA